MDLFDKIVENCIDYLLVNSDKIERYELERDLDRLKGGLNPLYCKVERVTGEDGITFTQRVPEVGPILYTKLMHNKRRDMFLSRFYDHVTDKEVDPRSLIGGGVFVKATIKIESIFIGSKICIQVKLQEATVERVQRTATRLLSCT